MWLSKLFSIASSHRPPLPQLVYVLAIFGWVSAIMGLCFAALKFAGIFRVNPVLEEEVGGWGRGEGGCSGSRQSGCWGQPTSALLHVCSSGPLLVS